jgi:hypothetical protein
LSRRIQAVDADAALKSAVAELTTTFTGSATATWIPNGPARNREGPTPEPPPGPAGTQEKCIDCRSLCLFEGAMAGRRHPAHAGPRLGSPAPCTRGTRYVVSTGRRCFPGLSVWYAGGSAGGSQLLASPTGSKWGGIMILYATWYPPRGHSYNSPGIESAPGCGPGSASAAPAGPPERTAAGLAPGPRPPRLAAMPGALEQHTVWRGQHA